VKERELRIAIPTTVSNVFGIGEIESAVSIIASAIPVSLVFVGVFCEGLKMLLSSEGRQLTAILTSFSFPTS
jgi:hypothetical protein